MCQCVWSRPLDAKSVMNIIFVSKYKGTRFSINLHGKVVLVFCLVLLAGIMSGGYWVASLNHTDRDILLLTSDITTRWKQENRQQQSQIQNLQEETDDQLQALTIRMAELQARILRLDALGEMLTTSAKLKNGEFDFSAKAPIGGPLDDIEQEGGFQVPHLATELDRLASQIQDREHQLEVLASMLDNKAFRNQIFLAGKPVLRGWMSSSFGRRTDPFTGRLAWHNGVDFAAKEGTDIIAVGSGVVTWSSKRYGYGLMVEVNHGNGYSTRYAHAKESLVKVGDVIKKGQTLALIGSSGRSTGPHVHFEVYKNGRAVDPATYIYRESR